MSEWISVKDKEFPRMKTILICNEYQSAAGYFLPGNTTNVPDDSFSDSPFKSPATHWQELPKIPK